MYNFNKIEKKWQEFWRKNKTYKVFEDSKKEKFYVLDMFPYPSGSGLSVGHPLGYIASDIYARYKTLKGFNVLHPMGYDSFGLPTEHYAIQTGIHPAIATFENTKRYRIQLDKIGFSYDWDREIQTSDPKYYKWTQWIFKQLFNSFFCKKTQKARDISELTAYFIKQGNHTLDAVCSEETPIFSASEWQKYSEVDKQKILLNYRLAFLSETWVNWCEKLGTVLANDEVKDGFSERGSYPVEQKLMQQWSLRITAYADRLLDGLKVLDWSTSIKEIQRNWIGKSVGANILFSVLKYNKNIKVFTTRPDTIFGVNFLVLAPEHPLCNVITIKSQKKDVKQYIDEIKLKSEKERKSEVKKITGVFTGSYAEHPITSKKIPIWIGDYVVSNYGTGAIMAVPCGDQRDWNFAQHFNIKKINVFKDVDISESANENDDIVIQNSDFLNNLSSSEAIEKVIAVLKEKGSGERAVTYRIRDAVFSRQRYWGEPFPVYYKNELPYLLEDNEVLELPEISEYLPTSSGEPPLARAKREQWKKFQGDRMEFNVMPGWAGSSWYFLRYMDPQNDVEFVNKQKVNYWKQVDLYIGGAEHAVGHLLYSRFWTKFLFDKGLIPFEEPFKKMINQGMILGRSNFVYKLKESNTFVSFDKKDKYETIRLHVDINLVENDFLNIEKFKKWRPENSSARFILNNDNKYLCSYEIEKMSKSKYNIHTPDILVEKFGADTLRLYEMFLGPIEQFKPWDSQGISGVHNFLKKFWKLIHNDKNEFFISESPPQKNELKNIHKTIKKVEEDIQRYSFNTVVSTLMICLNQLIEKKCNKRDIITDFTILLSPYTPHIAEEVWQKLGHKESITKSSFPKVNTKYLIDKNITYPVSFNGKKRFTIDVSSEASKEDIENIIMQYEKTIQYLNGNSPKKVIIVPNKIINFVV
ncbi:MAG: leucine--tRNA ligase [Bacteroidota bacterium]|nr:leucine--tRNA ligase [Bacteroidota bacterium]